MDIQRLEKVIQEEFKRHDAPIVTLEQTDVTNAIQSIVKHSARHVIQKSDQIEKDIEIAKAMLEDPKKFYKNPLPVILSKSNAQSFPIYASKYSALDEKLKFIDHIISELSGQKGVGRIEDQLRLVLDEIYTNGLLHTPAGQKGADPKKMPRIEVYCEDDKLVIIYKDSYGLLEIDQVLNRIADCERNGVFQSINFKNNPPEKKGAGIGLYYVYKHSSEFYLQVEKGRSTLISIVLLTNKMSDENVNRALHVSRL